MRIIGGKYRGKNLISPTVQGVRPTSDRAREAVFNILFSKLEAPFSEYNLLDVFAGTGAFGLEAISRGFKKAGFIDIDTKTLLRNIALFPNEKNNLQTFIADVSALPKAPFAYDVIFLDAPYNKGLSEKALNSLAAQGWLSSGALCIVESEHREAIEIPTEYTLEDERVYGIAKVSFLRYLA